MRLVGVPARTHASHEKHRCLQQLCEYENTLRPDARASQEIMREHLARTSAGAVAGHQDKVAASEGLLHRDGRFHANILHGMQRKVRVVEMTHEHPRELSVVSHLLEGVHMRLRIGAAQRDR